MKPLIDSWAKIINKYRKVEEMVEKDYALLPDLHKIKNIREFLTEMDKIAKEEFFDKVDISTSEAEKQKRLAVIEGIKYLQKKANGYGNVIKVAEDAMNKELDKLKKEGTKDGKRNNTRTVK